MRSTVKVLSTIAAVAMAAGLSACSEKDTAKPSSDGAAASSSTKEDSGSTASSDSTSSKDSKSSEGKDGTTKSGSNILEIKPVTFKDEQIGLTQTCDKAIEDYPAPKFKQSTGGSDSGTAYLLHCTLEFSGDFGYSSTLSDSASLQDKGDSSLKADEYGSLLANDLKADGLETFDIAEDSGVPSVEGWFAFVSLGKSTTLKPFSDGSTNIVYDRGEGENTRTGKHYGPYSDTQELVLK